MININIWNILLNFYILKLRITISQIFLMDEYLIEEELDPVDIKVFAVLYFDF